MHDTFANATRYNEWTVTDADTIGIFINFHERLQVAKITNPTDIPGYDPSMSAILGSGPMVVAADISLKEIIAEFPTLRVYSYCGTEIIEIGIDARDLYQPPNR